MTVPKTEEDSPSLFAQPGRAKPGKRRFLLIAIPTLVLCIGASALLYAKFAPDEIRDAKEWCKTETLTQLKSPATAVFGEISMVSFLEAAKAAGISPTKAPSAGHTSYIGSGFVDSQNGFGATVRSNISCLVAFEDGQLTRSGTMALVTEN